jgi:hypothetical protein
LRSKKLRNQHGKIDIKNLCVFDEALFSIEVTKNKGVYSLACVDIPGNLWTVQCFQGEGKVMVFGATSKIGYFCCFMS